MYTIRFSGPFQCRLATDPDDTDDPRGQNGWTFAFAGEPDLDRVIRFQDPSAPRSFAPQVGVKVADVNGDSSHPLAGALVRLSEDAKFEGRNGLIASPGMEPIAPFVLEIGKGTFRLTRRDDYVVTDPNSRKPHMGHGVTRLLPAEAAPLGVQDPLKYRAARLAKLQAALENETDATKRANLTARIDQLANFNAASDIQTSSLQFKVAYAHQLRSAGTIADPDNLLGSINLGVPWDISYWMGAWDADALQGFVDGSVSIAST
jgi:hypothetical protein